MKLLKANLRKGFAKVMPENTDDLWHLSQIIEERDIVKAKTARKVKATEDAKAEKKVMTVSLAVEKIEFTENTLRIGGRITEGPEDISKGNYHTITVGPSEPVELVKEKWPKYQADRLREACEAKIPKILMCVFDREEAFFALMKAQGHELLSKIKGEVQKKGIESSKKSSFWKQIIAQLNEYDERMQLDRIIIASPAFWKEELLKEVSDERLKNKFVQATCSSADETAFNEVMKRPEAKEALKEARTAKESRLVEQLLSEIARQGKAAYGVQDVENAAVARAVDALLITDSLIKNARAKGVFQRLNKIMKAVDEGKGSVVIVSGRHEAGRKLDGLGGVAALLRYKTGYE